MFKQQSFSSAQKKKLLILGELTLLIIVSLYMWGFSLKTEKYSVSSDKIDSRIKIVFISDLHNCTYGGKEQTQLWNEIEKASPDLVLFGGDIIDQYGDIDNALTIMRKSAEKYNCCYAEGNHEQRRDDLKEFEKKVKELGIPVLKGSCAEFEINNQKIRVYGITDSVQKRKKHQTQLECCLDDLDENYYNILLAHKPQDYRKYLGMENNTLTESYPDSFDLILSGHAHAGQWRIPYILDQGLYAPDQGIFPSYTNGSFEYGDTVHIISRGLAIPVRMCIIPRIFNRPELSVIEIV